MNGLSFSDASDIRLGSSTITALYYGSTLIWPSGTNWANEYLQVEALEPLTLTTNMPATKTANDILDVQYSTDTTTWNNWNENVSLSMQTGDIVYFKGSYILQTYKSSYDDNKFGLATTVYYVNSIPQFKDYKVQGNVMSLIYGDNFIGQTSLYGYDHCFNSLFGDGGIRDASNVKLPATTLANYCYALMFSSSSITAAPELPATTLAVGCYNQMFYFCNGLLTAPSILPATTLANYCYFSMFNYCNNLESAPQLPATTLTTGCYISMFTHCLSLNYVQCMATDISATDCTAGWLGDVSASGTFVKDANMNNWTTGDDGIPSGWTVQNA